MTQPKQPPDTSDVKAGFGILGATYTPQTQGSTGIYQLRRHYSWPTSTMMLYGIGPAHGHNVVVTADELERDWNLHWSKHQAVQS